MYFDQLMTDWKKELCSDFNLQPAIDEMGAGKLLDALLDNIGSPVSYVRENVLEALATLTCDMSVLSHEDYIHALNTSLSETHLFNDIGKDNDDAALCRAFVSFVVAQVIYVDGKQGFLSHGQYMEALNKATQYMMLEKDRRGFIYGGKGIVHAIPHGTSMLAALIQHPRFLEAHAHRILDCIKHNIVSNGRFAPDWADMELAGIITVLLIKGISEAVIRDWIETLLPPISAAVGKYTDEHYPYIQMGSDIQHFLMYLYYDLKKKSIHDELREWIFDYSCRQGPLWNSVYLRNPM
ncbi:MAG: DUF2785 domain-containing protein [Defluviitaleaceae bacterium]|nr:DUF2785 domain-containing protein [Defluviitaleaceae bacterium]